jgi:hypothetical protein
MMHHAAHISFETVKRLAKHFYRAEAMRDVVHSVVDEYKTNEEMRMLKTLAREKTKTVIARKLKRSVDAMRKGTEGEL